MTDYQFYTLVATTVGLICAGVGWLVAWIKSVDGRVKELEIETAVLKAVIKERGK